MSNGVDVKHEIILVRCFESISSYEDSTYFMESVGQWDIVTTEELAILKSRSYRDNFVIVERNPVQYHFKKHLRTPRDYIEDHYREVKVNEQKRKENSARLEAKKLERKKKQLERLKKELEAE